jgi:hypothetical protein
LAGTNPANRDLWMAEGGYCAAAAFCLGVTWMMRLVALW